MEKNKEKIKLRFILPLGLAILVLLATCVITLHQLHNHHINQQVQKSVNEVSHLFQTELEEDARVLEGIIGFLHKDKNLQDAWLAGDRQSPGRLVQCRRVVRTNKDRICKIRVVCFSAGLDSNSKTTSQ